MSCFGPGRTFAFAYNFINSSVHLTSFSFTPKIFHFISTTLTNDSKIFYVIRAEWLNKKNTNFWVCWHFCGLLVYACAALRKISVVRLKRSRENVFLDKEKGALKLLPSLKQNLSVGPPRGFENLCLWRK